MECEIKGSLPIPETLAVPRHAVEAITIGSTAAKLLNTEGVLGKVYGVFERTVNILTEAKELLTLARKDIENSPISLLIDLPPNISMSTFGIKQGASVTKSGPFIQIGNSDLLISLDKATLWKARRPIETSLAIKDIARNCDTAKDIGIKYGKAGGLWELFGHLDALANGATIDGPEFNLYSRKVVSPVTILLKAVSSRNLVDVSISANNLIGLGPGLTPAGDDMLTGFMNSLLLVTEALSGDVYYVREVNQTIASLVNGQTTLLSQKLLEHAARGDASELTHNVIETIVAGTEPAVRKATDKLLTVGHSSGTDTLLGILLGFQVAMKMA